MGLKPTYGRVSRYGLVAYGSSLDQIGPFGRTVADAALMLNGVVAGHDPADSTSVDESTAPVLDYLCDLDTPVDGFKIGIAPSFQRRSRTRRCARLSMRRSAFYRDAGADVVEIEMPHLDYAIAAYYMIATAEASSNLARYDGVHYGHRTENPADYVEVYSQVSRRSLRTGGQAADYARDLRACRAATTMPITSRP